MPQLPLVPSSPPWRDHALAACARHRFQRLHQLAAQLELPASDVAAGLEVLVRAKLLQRLDAHDLVRGSIESAYALSRAGALLLARTNGQPLPQAPNHRRSLLTLAHELGVAEIGVVADLLARRRRLRVLRFETHREQLAASIMLPGRSGLERIPLVADALLVIEHEGQRHGFLVEVDRGTVSVRRMRDKFRGYLAWTRGGGPERRFGLRALRVLLVVPSVTRRERLREAAIEAADGVGTGLFWFALEREVSAARPERLLEGIWSTARPTHSDGLLLFATTATDAPEADAEHQLAA